MQEPQRYVCLMLEIWRWRSRGSWFILDCLVSWLRLLWRRCWSFASRLPRASLAPTSRQQADCKINRRTSETSHVDQSPNSNTRPYSQRQHVSQLPFVNSANICQQISTAEPFACTIGATDREHVGPGELAKNDCCPSGRHEGLGWVCWRDVS